jgi:hypothetical protein
VPPSDGVILEGEYASTEGMIAAPEGSAIGSTMPAVETATMCAVSAIDSSKIDKKT